MERRRLGRGLDALLNSSPSTTGTADQARVPVGQVDPNPYQPRKVFDGEELASLSASIRNHGILQPLVVRAQGDRYQLIAGERRLRAAQAAGLNEVPVRLVDFNDQQVLEAALVENMQRTDLNPLEKAHGFQDYLQRFQLTQDELAARLGVDRSTVTNLVRLLDCPPQLQEWVRTGQLSAGHARTLLGLPDEEQQIEVGKQVISSGLTVRATEALVRDRRPEPPANGEKAAPLEKNAHLVGLEDELRQRLTTRVEIRVKAKDRGVFILAFESNDDFERLLEVLRK